MRAPVAAVAAASTLAVALATYVPANDPFIDPWMEHVVDLNVSVTYVVKPPALVEISVDVPYVTSTTAAGDGVLHCPTAYLVDFADPRPDVFTGVAAVDDWGSPKTTCAAYSFSYDPSRFDFPDVRDGDAQPYAAPPAPPRCPGHKFWFCDVPVDWRVDAEGERAVYRSAGPYGHIANFGKSCRNYRDPGAPAVSVAPLESGSVHYEWSVHVCSAGPYGPGCDRGSYAMTCRRFPAAFTTRAAEVESAAAVTAGCADADPGPGARVHPPAPLPSAGCFAGEKRFRLAFEFRGANPGIANVTMRGLPLFAATDARNETTFFLDTPCLPVMSTAEGYIRPLELEAYVRSLVDDKYADLEQVALSFTVVAPKRAGSAELCAYALTVFFDADAFAIPEYEPEFGGARLKLSMDEADPLLAVAWVLLWFGVSRAAPLL